MDDNNLLMIVLAFIVGFMLQGMMENMCGGRQVRYFEPSPGSSGSGSSGSGSEPCKSPINNSCQSGYCAGLYPGQVNGTCAPMPDELQKEIDKLKYDYWTSEFIE